MPISTRRAIKAQAQAAAAKEGPDASRPSSPRPGRGKGRRGAKGRQPATSPEPKPQEPPRYTAEEKGKQPMGPPETPEELRAKALALQAAGKGKLKIGHGQEGVVAATRPTLPRRTSPRNVTSLPPLRPAPILGAAAVAADSQADTEEPKRTRYNKSEMFQRAMASKTAAAKRKPPTWGQKGARSKSVPSIESASPPKKAARREDPFKSITPGDSDTESDPAVAENLISSQSADTERAEVKPSAPAAPSPGTPKAQTGKSALAMLHDRYSSAHVTSEYILLHLSTSEYILIHVVPSSTSI